MKTDTELRAEIVRLGDIVIASRNNPKEKIAGAYAMAMIQALSWALNNTAKTTVRIKQTDKTLQ